MRLGVLTRNPRSWESNQIILAARKRGIEPVSFNFSDILARVAFKPEATIKQQIPATNMLDALIVRPIGRGSLDEIVFRLDLLHRLEGLGLPIINSPSSIEKAVDKYRALTLLEENGVPVPRTIVTEDPDAAVAAFYELGGDVVIKPLFGSRGIGITRVSDPEAFERICRALAFVHHVLYVQEFVPHGTRDIRAFVVGEKVVAAMLRVSQSWKTNVSRGARPTSMKPSGEVEELAVKASKTLGCEVAGIDIMEGPNGYLVNEVNSQPGFRGLQLVTDVDIAEEVVDHVLPKVHR